MINLLTIDVEDYLELFFREYLGREVPVSPRVKDCTLRMLDLLMAAGVRATCFCLGSVARAHPDLIREIHGRGFEVASHGMKHLLFHGAELAEIRRDLSESRAALEDLIGEKVRGFRAPQFNVSLARPEVIAAIIESGYEYDSSIFPARGRRYGSPESPRGPYRIQTPAGSLVEFPLTTALFRGRRFPAAGGGYLRHFPYAWNRLAIHRLNLEGLPAVVYLHPYECDLERFPYGLSGLGLRAKFRALWTNLNQYHGRNQTLAKLGKLVRDFPFGGLRDFLEGPEPKNFPELKVG